MAAAAMLFALVVLVRNELRPEDELGYSPRREQPAISAADDTNWRPTRNLPPTPQSADYSPWAVTPTPGPLQVTPTPSPTPIPTPRPTPTPTPTPTKPNDFRGVVQADNGSAVARALVRVISGGSGRAAERSAVTDADGRFRIENIPDNKLDKVVVEANGYSVTMLQDIPLPLPDQLMIGMSPLTGIDALVLDFATTSSEPILYNGKMQASLLRLSKADTETTDALGISEPVLPVDTYLPVRDQSVIVEEGVLQFDNVEPGQYRIAIKAGPKVAESETLNVVQDSRTSASLILGMKHTVKGHVVGGDTAKAIAQARVSLAPAQKAAAVPDFPDYLSFTDVDGEFVIPEVQPGRYWLTVGATGYTTRSIENFTVQPAAAPEETSVTLEKQQPLITVSLLNGEGRPISQAPLVLMTNSGPTPKTYFGKTDEAGLYRFEHLLPGRFTLSVTAPGDRTRQKTVSIELGDGEVKEIPLAFGNAVVVTGKITADDKPYKGPVSFIMRGAAMADNLTNADEKGEFKVDLEPGDYLVGTPENPAAQSITIDKKETQVVHIKLK